MHVCFILLHWDGKSKYSVLATWSSAQIVAFMPMQFEGYTCTVTISFAEQQGSKFQAPKNGI